MKEDAQLVCPISFDDPDGHWEKLQQFLLDRLPLRDVTWKSPISSSYITIARLPLRFLPSSANLFKDTDHSFRWFLSPYVYVYILGAETLESYKVVKPSVKKWVDSHNLVRGSLGRSPWLIIYVPLGNYTYDSYTKVYSRICSDFYADKVGDRTVMLVLPNEDSPVNTLSMANMSLGAHGNSAMMVLQQSHNSFSDLLTKLRDGIVMSFQHRSALYDSDIRRLDSSRGSPSFDFRQLFLVKESLALLYQMMQLSDMALAQYEELEAILPFAPVNQLPDNDWPLVAPEPFKTGESEVSSPLIKEKEKDLMTDAVKNGDDVVVYSINLARMKILKNKMSLLELHRYVFARQMFFLITLQRPVHCAQKGLEFLKFCSNVVEKKVQTTAQVSIQQHEAGPFSVQLRMKQAEVWTLTSAIKILRVCRDLIKKIFNTENGVSSNTNPPSSSLNNDATSTSFSLRQSRLSVDSPQVNNVNDQLIAASSDEQSMDQTFRASSMLNERMFVLKESLMVLSEIMEFANSKLARLTPIGKYSKHLAFKAVSDFGYSYLQLNSSFLNCYDGILSTGDTRECELRNMANATEYFVIFYDAESAKTNSVKLQKELELVNSSDVNLDQMLVSISQRIRTASHYWAKLYGVERYKAFDHDETQTIDKYIILSEKANCTRLQVEVGRTLEISIYTLMNRALAEIYAFCDRLRFSNLSKMIVISTLLATNQHVISSRLLHELLYGAPKMKKDVGVVSRSINSWPELKMWALQALLLSALKTSDVDSMKQSFGWLTLESIGKSERNTSDWIERLIHCDSLSSLMTSNQDNDSIAPGCCLNVMPFDSFFSFSMEISQNGNSERRIGPEDIPPIKVRGYEMVNEEMFPVSVFQYVCKPDGHYLNIRIHSKFPNDFVIDRFAIIFKKLQPEIFQTGHQGGVYGYQSLLFQAQDESTTAEEERAGFVSNLFTPLDDEFVCDVAEDQLNKEGRIVLSPGEQHLRFKFSPTSLGEYGLDRMIMSKTNLVLFSKVLTGCSDWSALSQGAPSSSSGFGRRGWSQPTTPMSLSLNSMEIEHIPFSPFEIQTYFDRYSLIKVEEPPHLISVNVAASNISPPHQIDFISINLGTLPSDVIENIVIHVAQKEEAKKISREIKSNLASVSPTTLSIRAIDISSGRMFSRIGMDSALPVDGGNGRWKALDLGIKIADPEEWSVSVLDKQSHEPLKHCEVLYDFYFSSKNVHIGDINGNISNSKENSLQHLNILQQQFSQTSGYFGSTSILNNCSDQYEDLILSEEKQLAKCLKLINVAGDSTVNIQIPLIACPQCEYRKMQEIIFLSSIEVTIEGKLRRGSCLIPFQIQASNNISCGLLLTGNAVGRSLPPLIHDNLDLSRTVSFIQVNLHNLGPLTVSLVGYSILHCRNDRWDIIGGFQDGMVDVLNAPKDLQHFLEKSTTDISEFQKDKSLPLILSGEDFYASFKFSTTKGAVLNTLALRFYYLREESNLERPWSIENEHGLSRKINQLFHLDISISDSKFKAPLCDSSIQKSPISENVNNGTIPESVVTPMKDKFYSTLGTVTKISVIFRNGGGRELDVHNNVKLEMFIKAVTTNREDTSPYYVTPSTKALCCDNCLLRASIVDCQGWVNVGVKFNSSNFLEGLSMDMLVVPLTVGELLIPPIKLQVLRNNIEGKTEAVRDDIIHPIVNNLILVMPTNADLEIAAGYQEHTEKPNKIRRVTHLLSYHEEILQDSSTSNQYDE